MASIFHKILKIARGPLAFFYRKIVHALRRFLYLSFRVLYRVASFTGQGMNFQGFIHSHIANVSHNKKYTEAVQEILQDTKLIHLDVGARGGTLDIVQQYRSFFSVLMCEPDIEEANQLRNNGYKVIDKGLSRSVGEAIFYECRQPHGSSIKRPLGPYMDFYNADPAYLALYDIVCEHTIECTTISDALTELAITELDFLKLDTQGSELDILLGMGDFAPLVITCELQYLPLYHDTPTAYEVCQYLYDLGYIPFNLTAFRSEGTCPIEGDGFFMPGWEHPLGRKLIRGRVDKYVALMLMFNQRESLDFALRKLQLEVAIPPTGVIERLSAIFRG